MSVNYEPQFVFRDRHPERAGIYARFDDASADLRQRANAALDIRYGNHSKAKFDLFIGKQAAPLLVFIHGGYWQSLSKERYSFVAIPLVAEGWNVAVLGYPLAPEVNIQQITDLLHSAVSAVFRALRDRGVSPSGWAISGHSAGGHLAALLATRLNDEMPALDALVPISGLFDLVPLVGTTLNKKLNLTVSTAEELSPLNLPCVVTYMEAIVGKAETPEFQRQSSRFAAYFRRAGKKASLHQIPQANHYSILLDFLERRSVISDIIMRTVKP